MISTGERIEREARNEGRAQGHAEGHAEGHLEGQRGILTRLLVARFGPLPGELEARVRRATSNELEQWAERVLTVASLEALFA